jgi:YbbR domain-containing protein
MSIKRFFVKDFGLKIFSLFLAIGVWAMITGEARSKIEKFINVDVEFINVLKNVNIFSNPDKVRIKIKGTVNEIKLISEKDFSVKIDLSNVRDGIRNYYTRDFLKTDKLGLIEYVHPTMIEVNVREIIRKSIQVKVRFIKKINGKKRYYRQGRIGEIGYNYNIIPDRITVEGYKNEINGLSYLITEEVELPEQKEKIIRVKIKKPSEVLRIIDNNEIEIKIKKKE